MAETRDGEDRITGAFEQLWPTVHGYALRLLNDSVEADDVAQEAFLRLLVLHRADRWPDTPMAWLSIVVRNLVVTRARRTQVARRRAPDLEQGGASRGGHRPLSDSDFLIDAGPAISKAFERLPAERRRAVLLSGAGYSAREISAEIGRTPDATRTLICRSRHVLRAALAGEMVS
jgi:RNA polymerase sigma-70 factor (ECF subfamily)